MSLATTNYTTQNELLLHNLMDFYTNETYLTRMLKIITGESKVSLRIVDWFATNSRGVTHPFFVQHRVLVAQDN